MLVPHQQYLGYSFCILNNIYNKIRIVNMYYYKTYLKDRDSPSKIICPKLFFQARLFSFASVLLALPSLCKFYFLPIRSGIWQSSQKTLSSEIFYFLLIQSGKSHLAKNARLLIWSAKKAFESH